MNRSKSCLIAGLLTGGLSLCLIILLGGAALVELPQRTEHAFGLPTTNLDELQRFYLSIRLLTQHDLLTQAADPLGVERIFEIQLGESTYQITERLQAEGLIPDGRAFRDYLVYSGLDTSLQAGKYTLNTRMTPVEIAAALQDATPEEITFYILPGWRMEEIADALPTSGLSFSAHTFLEKASHPTWDHPLKDNLVPSATLEGFLFPDQYRLSRQASTKAFINTALENFQIKITFELRSGFERQGLSLFQAVTLASIVERESIVDDEMPLIASVFYNRLAVGMNLDSDPTVQYALGYNKTQNTWWTNPLSLEDLKIDSLYNTYIYAGLPPGPIANPGLNALKAVAFPANTPYYYFPRRLRRLRSPFLR